MKSKLFSMCCITFICNVAIVAYTDGYETPTHSTITLNAFRRSVLSDGYLQQELGILPGQKFKRKAPLEWLQSGSIFEDDYVSGGLLTPRLARFANHFFDPAFNRGLSNGILVGQRAFDWALEEAIELPGQEFSWRDARNYFLTGLTAQKPLDRENSLALTFRSLGQVSHLVQDMGSPEHTRNDIHAGLPILGLGEASLFEHRVDARRDGFDYGGYPSPILDRLQHFWWTNDGTGRGLAEFTNRNFITKSTNFTRTLDGNSGIGNYPSQGLGMFPSPILRTLPGYSTTVDVSTLPEPPPIAGKITFFGNDVIDPATGGSGFNERMTTYSLFDNALRSVGKTEIFTINRYTVDASASILLPRAASYSTGLIDYFFRGKMELDVSTDADDVSLVRVEGINRSSEKLDGGTLMLYGEDPNGNRSPATAVGSTTIFAEPGQPIAASFRLPANTEKLMAVYRGKIGNETPQGNFPGGVIGKLLSPQRVEQIFTDFVRWYIRTPQGVFPLPILKQDVEDLQWGDNDNTLVGRSPIGPGQPNIFYSYKINRLLGATNLPLVIPPQPLPDQPTLNQIVDIQLLRQVSFPFGIDVGTNVDFTHVMPYKQYLLWMTTTDTVNWKQTNPDDPNGGFYDSVGASETTARVSLLVQDSKSTRLTYPIILNENSHIFGTGSAPYYWDVWSIHLTSDGRPLAMVQVTFTSNNLGFATLPSRTLSISLGADGEVEPQAVDLPPVQVPFALPELGPAWMVIDITTGQVLANTAPPTLFMHHTNGRTAYSPNPNTSRPTVQKFYRTHFNGGPQAGFRYTAVSEDSLAPRSFSETPFCTAERLNTMNVLATQLVAASHIETILNQNRSEIASIEFGLVPSTPTETINFPDSCGDEQTPPSGFRISVLSGRAFGPNNLDGLLRTTPVGGTEQLVLLMTQAQTTSSRSNVGRIAIWNPAQSRLELKGEFLDQGLHILTSASRAAGLVISYGGGQFANFQTRLVRFGANSLTTFPNEQLFDYTLLDPEFFYNMNDFKFHLKDPSLESTGFPAQLATTFLFRNPLGRHHIVAVR